MKTDPGILKEKRILKKITNILEAGELEDWQREALERFWKFIDFRGLKLGSKRAYLQDAKGIIIRAKKPPEEWTDKTIIGILDQYRRRPDGRPYAARTRNHVREGIKYFLLCYDRVDLLKECESKYSKVGQMMKSEAVPRSKDENEDFIITFEQMRAISSKIQSYSARVFFWVIWDTGARLDDLCMITLSGIEWDPEGTGAILTVPQDTKTGARSIVLRYSLGWFRQYMSQHPYAELDSDGKYIRPDIAVFLSDKGEAWSSTDAIGDHFERGYAQVLELQDKKDWLFKERVPKGLTPKSLRTSAVNRDMEEGLDAETNAYHHGHSVMVMLKRYRKVNKKREVKSKIDALAGITREKEKKKEVWRSCPKCSLQNPPENEYCGNCGDPVSPAAILASAQTPKKTNEEIKLLQDQVKKLTEEFSDYLGKELKEKGFLPKRSPSTSDSE